MDHEIISKEKITEEDSSSTHNNEVEIECQQIETKDDIQTNENTSFSKINTKRLVSIEYPGFIKNVQNMLNTMGGEKKISHTYFKSKTRLQMTYRPEDLNAHYVHGDLIPCTGLLLKVKRRKKKVNSLGSETFEYNQEIIGIIKNQYKFQTLMDFQYLTPEPLWNYFKDIHGSELGQQKFPPYYAPTTFGRIDNCGTYNYRPDSLSQKNFGPSISKEIKERFENDTKEALGAARKRRQTESMAALFDIEEVPEGPTEKSVAIINNLTGSPEQETIEIVRRLFEERPMWSKLAVSCHLKNKSTSFERLKKVLQYFAYYWLSGPWRTMWCRMGYDPRKDRSAKIYQMVDFRIRDSKETRKQYVNLVPKRSYKNYVPRNLQSRSNTLGSSVLAACDPSGPEEEKQDEDPYIFHPNKILPSRNMMYQLCDLHDEEVQKIIHAEENQSPEINDKEGWFLQGTMSRIRKQMGVTVQNYFAREKQKKKNLLKGNNDENNINKNESINMEDKTVQQVFTFSNENLEVPHNSDIAASEPINNIDIPSDLNLPGLSKDALAEVTGGMSYLQMLQEDEYANDFLTEEDGETEDDMYYM